MLNDRAIKIAFIISLTLHCLCLCLPRFDLDSLRLEKPDDIIVTIEIERPPLLPKIDTMGEEKKLKEIVEKPQEPQTEPELKPRSEEVAMEEPSKEQIKENIQVINPAEEAMLRYQDMVKQRIESARRYPVWAKRQGIEGVVHLNFTVLSNGLSREVTLVRSSGYEILNQEAVSNIKRANPFPPIPAEIKSSSIKMDISIVYTLK